MNNVNENHVFSSIQDFAKKVANTNNLDQMYDMLLQEFSNPETRYFLLKALECFYRDKKDYYCSCRTKELAFHAEMEVENGKIE